MENRKNEFILNIHTASYTLIILALSESMRSLMRSQFNLSYSQKLSFLIFLIIISFGLGNIPLYLIKRQRIKKIEFNWLKSKKNHLILVCVSFIFNIFIMILFIFIYKGKYQIDMPYFHKLILDCMFFILAYGFGIAAIYTKEFISKKISY
ncbi:MAG: hypothetical protein AAGU14_07400, partial [Eubacteriaceae bacterium]